MNKLLLLFTSLSLVACASLEQPAQRPQIIVETKNGQSVARVVGCDQPIAFADAYRNQPSANFGCASARNLAAMVANPDDLVAPAALGAADAEAQSPAIGRYRAGEARALDKNAFDDAD